MTYDLDVIERTLVVGRNSESADMDNPDGDVFDERYFIVAEAADGSRFIFQHAFMSQDEAERFILTVEPLEAVGADWEEDDPRYGSEAYQDYGWLKEQRFDA